MERATRWYTESDGFNSCDSEPCLYKSEVDGKPILVAIYVDDLIIACKDKETIIKFKRQLSDEFEVTDKGVLSNFLGIKVNRDGELGSIKICQSQYIKEILEQYQMSECKTVSVPLDPGFRADCSGGCKRANKEEYQSIIGALTYLAITTRPDIMHTISKMAQFNSDPHSEHMSAVKHVLRYLKATNMCVKGFADADWGGNTIDRKSYYGYFFFIGECLISWESKKQVALSSTEAEYMSMSNALKEATYLNRLLSEIGICGENPILLKVDNQGAMKLAVNPVYHNRTKHIDIKYHHVREVISRGEILPDW